MAFSLPALTQKISVEELITRHQASIAAMDKLSSIRNQFVLGEAQFKVQGSAALLSGRAVILSEKGRVAWAMSFHSNDYPQDKFGFDGKKVIVNRTTPEGRSLLTQFINDNRKIVEDGLFGGALSGSWALLGGGKGRLKVSGSKKIDGRDTIVVDYSPKGGADFSTKLYFDAETYRHVRSEYTVTQGAVQGPSVDSSAGQASSMTRLVEEFSDFRKMGDLTLPSVYKVTYSRSGVGNVATQAGTSREAEWSFRFTNFAVNQELDGNAFAIEG